MHEEGLDQLVCDLLHLKTPQPDLTNWRRFVQRIISPSNQVTIAVVGKYIDLQDAYKSIYESLTHAAARLNRWFSESIARIRTDTRAPTGQDC